MTQQHAEFAFNAYFALACMVAVVGVGGFAVLAFTLWRR